MSKGAEKSGYLWKTKPIEDLTHDEAKEALLHCIIRCQHLEESLTKHWEFIEARRKK